MRQSIIFTMPSILFLSVLASPAPSDNQLVARQTYYGQGTWFYDGLGACQWKSVDSDIIVALSAGMYGDGGNCGRGVSVTNTANGATVNAKVVDKCPGCGQNDLDLSLGAFQQIGDPNTGRLSISWYFM